MSRLRARAHDRSCVEDAKQFLNQLYEFSGIPLCDRPTWKTEKTPDNINEQAVGEFSCGLHVAAQVILASHGMWLTHTFNEEDIDILRLRLTDTMIDDGFSMSLQPDNSGRCHHIQVFDFN